MQSIQGRLQMVYVQGESLRPKKKKGSIPFDFVLDLLDPSSPRTEALLGGVAVYCHQKLLLLLREKEGHSSDNGVWFATSKEHHQSLKAEFPYMRSIAAYGSRKSAWQILPSDSDDFERAAALLCELILNRDPRIGRSK